MQNSRKKFMFFGIILIVFVLVGLVLLFIRLSNTQKQANQFSVTHKKEDYKSLLQEVLESQIPFEKLRVEIDDKNIIRLSAELTKENFKALLEHYDIPLQYATHLLPNRVSAEFEFKLIRDNEEMQVSVLQLSVANIDLTSLLGTKISDKINRAIKEVSISKGYTRLFT